MVLPTDLTAASSTGHIAHHEEIHAFVNTHGLNSGFPQRTSSPQISVLSRKEFSHVYSQGNGAFTKSSILCEHWAAGSSVGFILRRLWNAIQSGGNYSDPVEDKGIYSFWIDNDGTDGSGPAFTLSVAELFGWIYSGGVPANGMAIRMGRTSKGAYNSLGTYSGGGHRAFWLPVRRYLRVEYSDQATSNTDVSIFYNGAQVDQLTSIPGTQQQYFKIFTAVDDNHPKQTPLTIVDTSVSGPHGPGQLESIMFAFNPTGSDAILEGNVQIYTDNDDGNGLQLYWEATGGEDFLLGSWGLANPAYPIVASTSGNAGCFTRFFTDDPIYFAKDIKVVWWVGQPAQGAWDDNTVPVKANAGIWFDTNPQTIKYYAPDFNNQLFNEDFNYTAGALDTAKFNLNGSGTQFTGSGSSTAIINDTLAADCYLTVKSSYFSPPANYWVEARMRQGYTTGILSELGLSGIAFNDANAGNSGTVEMFTDPGNNLYMWMRAREAFAGNASEETVGTTPSAGWANIWFKVAMKVVGSGSANPTCYGYYKFDDPSRSDNYWHPIGRWTHTANNGGLIGLWAWLPSAAEVDYIRVYALNQYTS